jgi:hypothetical protein
MDHLTVLAYIDPGTGTLIWQSITAALIGVGFYFRRFWGKVHRKDRGKNRAEISDLE